MNQPLHKPTIFIGSSSQNKEYVILLKKYLEKHLDVKPWYEYFEPSDYTLDRLLKETHKLDYGVFFLFPDDKIEMGAGDTARKSKSKKLTITRDNVLFEIGVFMALLGRKHVFTLYRESKTHLKPRILSNLEGYNYIEIPSRGSGPEEKYLKMAAEKILAQIKKHRNSPLIREIKGEFVKSIRKLSDVFKEDSEFKLPFVLWRIKKEHEKFEKIKDGEWEIKAKSTAQYMRYIFTQVLERLEKDDSYLTLTNMDFWSKEFFGVNGFITANEDAIARGVKIKRIMLIPEEVFMNKKKTNKTTHRKDLKKLIRRFLGSKIVAKSELFFCCCNTPNDDEYRDVPYVVIKREKENASKYLTIKAMFPANNDPKVSIHFNEGDEVHGTLTRFFDRHFSPGTCPGRLFTLKQMAKELHVKAR